MKYLGWGGYYDMPLMLRSRFIGITPRPPDSSAIPYAQNDTQ